MNRKKRVACPWALFALSALFLAACGGEDDAPAELTGKLHGGRLQGIAFRTESRSGTTDASGQFTYRPGEQVSFLVGSIEIGRATGAADISLFTLAGLTPPSTERSLRQALDIATRSHSPFTRAMNLDLLMLALDADGNPDNGVDVRGRRDSLSGVTLDFDLPYRDFAASLYRAVPDLTQNISPMLPVVHLYGPLGIKVSAHARTEVRYESQGTVTLDTYTYYPNGALQSNQLDIDADGFVESRTSYEYDPQLRFTTIAGEADLDFDLMPEAVYSGEREYDAHGHLVGSTEWQIQNGGEATQWRLTDVEYDSFGRVRHQVVDFDDGIDGVVDQHQIYTIDYDERGNGTGVRWVGDSGADGVDDVISQSIYQYDSTDRLTNRVDDTDDGADGIVDSRITWAYAYADRTQPIGLVIDSDSNADSLIEQRQRYEWTYDIDGNILISAAYNEIGAPGSLFHSVVFTREYDSARRITRSERTEDIGGDGAVDTRQVDVIEYDDLGNEVWRTSEYDTTDDGVVDLRILEGAEFGADGEMLAMGSGLDWDGDGLSEIHTSQTVTSVLLTDGVLHLAQWYFMNRQSYVDGGVVGF